MSTFGEDLGDTFEKYPSIKDSTREGLVNYIENGQPPGDFLSAVLMNDLHGAFSRADLENRRSLEAIVRWIYWEAPSKCHGSADAVKGWIGRKR